MNNYHLKQQKSTSFDWQATLKIVNQNEELAKEIIDLFKQDLPKISQEIQQAYQDKDCEALYAFAHKLHGSCCYCVAPKLKAIAEKLQKTAKQDDWASISTLIIDLANETTNLNKLL